MKVFNFFLALAAGLYWGVDVVSWFISLLVWGALTVWLARCTASLIHGY